ncbi:MAG: carboxypeptidase regulatory-like domain-containing protein [Acidimicrobiia bacterium]|nr:carboxypeptidase regulatory-like domain-containing protein [Acidimicrobiia bacterium]
MTTSTRRTIVLLALGLGLIGCEGSLPPLAPSPVQPPAVHVTGDQLTGNVYDTARRPLADARIEVLDGPEAGLLTTSDSLGRFSLPGTFDDTTRFRASKDGYVAAIATRNFCAQCNIHRWWINLVLDLVAAPVNIAGEYTLTIVASGACSALPADFRTRTYTASVVPAPGRPNTSFDVKVSGAQFLQGDRHFTIKVAGDFIAGTLGYRHDNGLGYHDEPGLVEQVAPNTYLAFGGWFGASVTDVSTIVAPLDAFIDYCVTPSEMGPVYSCGPGQFVEHAECTSTTHQLLLRRR